MKYQDLYQKIKKPYFSMLDLSINKLQVYNYQLTQWVKKGYLIRIKRGFYVFSTRKNEISPDEISFLLYQPSYISLESALSRYGLIPEMLQATTAITTKTTRTMNNSVGNFIYKNIKPTLFFGYKPVETKTGKYLIAEPEKALLDYFYLKLGEINREDDLIELRLNCGIVKEIIDRKKIDFYLEKYNTKKMKEITNLFFDEVC